MNRLAIRMIMGDRMKYFGLLFGLAFAAMLITQQASIFMGYTQRMWAFFDDTPHADVWVMDPQTEFSEDRKALPESTLYITRGVKGVAWAMPLYRAGLLARLSDGTERAVRLVGVDDATLMGGPMKLATGSVEDLRQSDGVIVERRAAEGMLRVRGDNGQMRSLRVGDSMSINDRAARVVGISENNTPFYWEPTVYTTYSKALTYAPPTRKQMTYVMVRLMEGEDPERVCDAIEEATGKEARTSADFGTMTMWYTLINTGILVNFGITVGLGIVIGLLVGGQTFFNYVADNARYFGALKALGVSNTRLLGMVFAQVLVVGGLGFGIGAGLASMTGQFLKPAGVGFFMPWQLLAGSCVMMVLICLAAAGLASIRVLRLEPAVVFKG